MGRVIRFAFHLLLGALVLPSAAGGASLRDDILYLLPRESAHVAFIDLKALRATPHYSLLKQRLLPERFGHFERFVRSTGLDIDKDLEWLAWVLVPEGPDNSRELFLGLAQGQFHPEVIERFFLEQSLPLDAYRGQTLFPFGSSRQGLLFTFLDSSTAIFGTRAALERLLETRFGAHENLLHNETLLQRLKEANGNVPVWVVLDDHYTQLAVRQLLPEAAKFPEFARIADRFRASLFQLELGRELTLRFQAWCQEPADAQVFSLLLQTGLWAKGWQAQEANPALSSVLEGAEVKTAGDRLDLQVAIEEKDLRALLQRNLLRF